MQIVNVVCLSPLLSPNTNSKVTVITWEHVSFKNSNYFNMNMPALRMARKRLPHLLIIQRKVNEKIAYINIRDIYIYVGVIAGGFCTSE